MPTENRHILPIVTRYPEQFSSVRGVRFRFSSKEEGDLYRLAAELQRIRYRIEIGRMENRNAGGGPIWYCEARRIFLPDKDCLNRACLEMLHLANLHKVTFDRWYISETGISTSCENS